MFDINVTVFIESPICKTFLFESSKYWASEGFQVHYISSYIQEDLPPLLHGVKSEGQTYAEFMQITFLTAPNARDFINYMINLRKAAHIPKVLVVEDITTYAENSSESEYLLMCSFLKSTIQFCSQVHGSTASLIISSKFKPDELNKINLILTPSKIWRSYENTENKNYKRYILREISLNPTCNNTKELHFSLLEKSDGNCIRLNSIKHLFEDNCKFNNVIL